MFVLAVLFLPDAVRSRGSVRAGWCRWQLPAELGLHRQMEDDRELLPAPIHLPHHLCWEGDQLHTKPKTWQLGLIPSVAPTRDVGVLSSKPRLLSGNRPGGAGCCGNSQPCGSQQSLVLVWMRISRLRALLLSPCRQNPQCWGLQLMLAAEGCPSVQREKPSALTHCSTTSYFWQKPAQADSEDLGRTEHLQ